MRRRLATIAEGEHCPPIRGDQALLAAGWRRRYLADAARADDARELYRALGFDVLLRSPTPVQMRSECAACAQTACRDYFLIYTKRRIDDA